MMSVQEILQSVEFVVDHQGKPKSAVVDMKIWEAFVTWLEQVEDQELVQSRSNGWREKKGWRRWEEFETELNADELPTLG